MAADRSAPALAARFATEFNTPFVPVDFFTAQCDRVRAACTSIDRDPSAMAFSAALVVCVGADEAAATIRRWAEAGAERIYLQVLDLADLDLIATELAPLLA